MSIHYLFPRIRHIDDVLPYIDEACFRVVEKDCGNTYINYVRMGDETFPPVPTEEEWLRAGDDQWELHNLDQEYQRAVIRRECRGLVFDTATGKLVSRPFHKFFNVGEREDLDYDSLRFDSDAHVVQDKIDGSMVRPIPTPLGMRWATKMGITDVAMAAEAWLVDHPDYAEMASYYMQHGYTPLFEFTSPGTRIVVDYGVEPTMTLLAVRSNLDGGYLLQDALENIGDRWGIPVVGTHPSFVTTPKAFVDAVKLSDLDEGIVIQWDNGHRVKVKTETYTILHRVKEAARTERTLVTAVLDQSVDDLLPLLPTEDRAKVTKYIHTFWGCMDRLAIDVSALYTDARLTCASKKEFAISTAKTLTQLERAMVFGLWDNKILSPRAAAMLIIKGGLASETKWAEMKQKIEASAFRNFDTSWGSMEVVE